MLRKHIGLSLVLCWGVFVMAAFWLFTYKDLRPFADNSDGLARFPKEVAEVLVTNEPLPSSHGGRVIHFWNPNCRCSRFSQEHVEEVMSTYVKQGIEFIVAVPAQRLVERALETFPEASNAIVVNQTAGLSSPSAIVFDAQNTLVYFGPYSDGAFCASGDSAPVELMLDDVVSQDAVTPWLNLSTFGCYCDWPNQR